MDREDKHIVVIELQQSVVARGIKNKLEELHYKVTEIGDDAREISRHSGKVDLFMMYLSDSIIDHPGALKIIHDTMEDADVDGQKMVLVAEKDFMVDFVKKHPDARRFEHFLLPINMDKLGSMIDEVIGEEGEGARKRVLIVDDDPSYAKMVRGWIADDFQTNIVTNGTQAITFLTKNKVDLILLDYEMPVVDGPQVFEMIKSEPDMAEIPVVFLTGNGTREGVHRVMQMDPAGYVLKGTSKLELITKIKNVLARYNK